MKNIHIMPDSPYSFSFIEMINKANLPTEDIFIVLSKKKNNNPKKENIIYFNHKIIKEYFKLKGIKGDNIFFHSINTVPIIISKILNKKAKNKIWVLWGYDLYKHLDIELYNPKTLKYFNNKNKKTIKSKVEGLYIKCYIKSNIKYILNWNKFDVDIAEDFFNKKFIFTNFFYPLDINKNTSSISSSGNMKNIMVGNSGDPSNNHFEIFDRLKDLGGNFNVISFLSYGNKEYIQNVIEYGKKLFGTKFKAYTEFIPRDEYYNLINDIDVLILNHNRQQGVGNILPFINNKKVVVLNKYVSTYAALNDLGLKIKSIDQLDLNLDISDSQLDENSNVVFNHFNNEKQMENYKHFIEHLSKNKK